MQFGWKIIMELKGNMKKLVKTKYLSEINGMDFINEPEQCRIKNK